MEGNFLSRYTNKVETWEKSIRDDPINKSKYEYEMSQYIIQCMPYLELYTDELKKEVSTNNVFNCKETSGLPNEWMERYSERCFTLPMMEKGVRSLNLGSSVAVVVYDGLRQLGKF